MCIFFSLNTCYFCVQLTRLVLFVIVPGITPCFFCLLLEILLISLSCTKTISSNWAQQQQQNNTQQKVNIHPKTIQNFHRVTEVHVQEKIKYQGKYIMLHFWFVVSTSFKCKLMFVSIRNTFNPAIVVIMRYLITIVTWWSNAFSACFHLYSYHFYSDLIYIIIKCIVSCIVLCNCLSKQKHLMMPQHQRCVAMSHYARQIITSKLLSQLSSKFQTFKQLSTQQWYLLKQRNSRFARADLYLLSLAT